MSQQKISVNLQFKSQGTRSFLVLIKIVHFLYEYSNSLFK